MYKTVMANIYIRSESKEYNKNGRQHENRIKISSNNLFVNIINSQ